ncbi:MAG: hypothetical protein QXF35_04505 [Candidatus Bilamarchaeaceae archaeon]
MNIKHKRFIKRSSFDSVKKLLEEARLAFDSGKIERANRYVRMCWEIVKKNRVRLPKEYKNSFCRKCLSLWVPGSTAIVYFDKKNDCLRIRCLKCGFSKRL